MNIIQDIGVDGKGNVFLADAGRASILILGQDAKLIGRIGRPGAGPGEFRILMGMELIDGDTILSWDAGNARMTFFSPTDRRPARMLSLPSVGGGMPVQILTSAASQGFVATFERPFVAGQPRESDSVRVVTVGLLDSLGHVVSDSITSLPIGRALVVRSSVAVTARYNPFASQATVRRSGNRVVFIITSRAAVYEMSLDSHRVDSVPLPYRPKRLTRDVVEDSAAVMEEMFRPALRKAAPEYWPVLRELVQDPTGEIWVGVVLEPGHRVGWVLIDRNGHLKARIDVPWNITLKAAQGDLLYAAALDEDDVPRVLILRHHAPMARGS